MTIPAPPDPPAPRRKFSEQDAKALLARLIMRTPASPGIRSLAELLEDR